MLHFSAQNQEIEEETQKSFEDLRTTIAETLRTARPCELFSLAAQDAPPQYFRQLSLHATGKQQRRWRAHRVVAHLC